MTEALQTVIEKIQAMELPRQHLDAIRALRQHFNYDNPKVGEALWGIYRAGQVDVSQVPTFWNYMCLNEGHYSAAELLSLWRQAPVDAEAPGLPAWAPHLARLAQHLVEEGETLRAALEGAEPVRSSALCWALVEQGLLPAAQIPADCTARAAWSAVHDSLQPARVKEGWGAQAWGRALRQVALHQMEDSGRLRDALLPWLLPQLSDQEFMALLPKLGRCSRHVVVEHAGERLGPLLPQLEALAQGEVDRSWRGLLAYLLVAAARQAGQPLEGKAWSLGHQAMMLYDDGNALTQELFASLSLEKQLDLIEEQVRGYTLNWMYLRYTQRVELLRTALERIQNWDDYKRKQEEPRVRAALQGHGEALAQVLLELLGRKSCKHRDVLVSLLAEQDSPAAVPAFFPLLGGKQAEVSAAALRGLNAQPEAAMEAVPDMLEQKQVESRRGAILFLESQPHSPQVASWLEPRLGKERSRALKEQMQALLGRSLHSDQDKPSQLVALERIAAADPSPHSDLIRALAGGGKLEAIPSGDGFPAALLAWMTQVVQQGLNYQLKLQLQQVMAACAGYELLPWLWVEAVRQGSVTSKMARERVVQPYNLPDKLPPLSAPLRHWLGQPGEPAADTLFSLLCLAPQPEDAPLLAQGLEDKRASVRKEASKALKGLGHHALEVTLAALDHKKKDVRAAAGELIAEMKVPAELAGAALPRLMQTRALQDQRYRLSRFIQVNHESLEQEAAIAALLKLNSNLDALGTILVHAGEQGKARALELLEGAAEVQARRATLIYFKAHPCAEAVEGIKALQGLLSDYDQRLHNEVLTLCQAASGEAIYQMAEEASELDLDARLAQEAPQELPSLEGLDLAALPALRWRSGEAMSPQAARWVVHQLVADPTPDNRDLYALRRRWSTNSASTWLRALGRAQSGGAPWAGWAVGQGGAGAYRDLDLDKQRIARMFGPMADEALIEELHEACVQADVLPWTVPAVFAVNALPAAIGALEHWARKGLKKGPPRDKRAAKHRAQRSLESLARRLGLDTGSLALMSVPSLGFDASGEQPFVFGERTLTLRVTPEGKVEVLEEGQARASLPSARAHEDVVQTEKAKAAFKQLKAQLRKHQKAQLERLEQALVQGTVIQREVWRAVFADHPVGRGLGRGLVFGARLKEGQAPVYLTLSASGQAQDAQQAPVALPLGALLWLAHPAELEPTQRQAWRAYFKAQGLPQPLEQLEREIYALPQEGEPFAALLQRSQERPQDPHKIIKAFQSQNMSTWGEHSGGHIDSALWELRGHKVTLYHSGWPVRTREASTPISLHSVSVAADPVPAALYSEVMRFLGKLYALIV